MKTYKFNFDTDDFATVDGKLVTVEGVEAIKVWVEKIIRTEKYKYKIYSTDQNAYGITLQDLLIGHIYPIAFVKSEVEREIKEALLKNPEITSVTNFIVSQTNDTAIINFLVNSIYSIEVNI